MRANSLPKRLTDRLPGRRAIAKPVAAVSALLLAASAASLAACSGGADPTPSDALGATPGDDETPGQGGGGGDGSRSADAGSTKDGAGADAAVELPPEQPRKVGRIYAGQTITIASGQTFYSSYATAMFTELPEPPSTATACTYDHVGACHVYDCPLGGSNADAGAVRYAGAGTVNITGGLTSYALTVDPGSYVSVSSQQLLFDSGTVLSVSATGNEVPPFAGKSITVPSTAFAVSSPSLAGSLGIARTSALSLAWSGAGSRPVKVNVATVEEDVRSVSIACEFPGASGAATIPAVAMAKLLATSSATKGTFSIEAPVENTFSAGEWVVTFSLMPSPSVRSFTTTN